MNEVMRANSPIENGHIKITTCDIYGKQDKQLTPNPKKGNIPNDTFTPPVSNGVPKKP